MKKTANDSEKFSKHDFSRQNQIGVLGVHFSQTALNLFVTVFLTARLLKAADGASGLGMVGIFYAISYTTIMLSFWLFSYIVKKFSRVWCIRVSTIFLLGNTIMVLLFRNKLADYYLILAVLYGIAQGIFWCSIHTFTTEALGGKKMAGYIGWFISLSAFANIVFPFTLGAIIEFINFTAAALIATGISIVLLLFTLVLRDQRKNNGVGFSLRAFFRHLREKQISRPMWSQFLIQSMYGIQTMVTICITILIVRELDSDYSLGALTSVFSAVALVTVTVYKTIKAPKLKIWIYYAASMIPLCCAVVLLFSVSHFTIILCMAGYTGFRVASQTELDRTRMNLMSDFDAEHLHTEGVLFTEFSYFIVRVVVSGLIVLAAYTDTFFLFQAIVVTLIALVPLSAILLHLWTKKYIINKHVLGIIKE